MNFEFSRIPKKCFWNITGYDIDPPCWIWWHKMKVWHPWQKKKLKSWEPFRSYHLNSPANSANFAWFLVKVVVAPKRPPGFWIFTCLGCRIFILCEIHCYLCPPKSWHNNSCLGSVLGTAATKEWMAVFLSWWDRYCWLFFQPLQPGFGTQLKATTFTCFLPCPFIFCSLN